MTTNSYEELEARLRDLASLWSPHSPAGYNSVLTGAADALADLRKQRDEAKMGVMHWHVEAAHLRRELATLRVENERLTRERDNFERQLLEAHTSEISIAGRLDDANAEAERLRKVAEGERERICQEAQIEVVLPDFESDRGYRSMWKCLPPEWEAAIRALPPPNLSSKED